MHCLRYRMLHVPEVHHAAVHPSLSLECRLSPSGLDWASDWAPRERDAQLLYPREGYQAVGCSGFAEHTHAHSLLANGVNPDRDSRQGALPPTGGLSARASGLEGCTDEVVVSFLWVSDVFRK